MVDLPKGHRPVRDAGDLFTRCQQQFGLFPDEVMWLLGVWDAKALQAHGDYDEIWAMVERRLELHSGRVLRPAAKDDGLAAAMADAERRAWESLAKYRFQKFGHYAELWASLAKVSGKSLRNPFAVVASVGRRQGKRG